MQTLPERSRGQQITATMGGLLFAGSLVYFGWSYAFRFGQDAIPLTATTPPILVDVLLFAAFGVHHSMFARSGIKSRVRAFVGPDMDRTVYVIVASLLFVVMTACWQLVPGTLWRVDGLGAWLLRLVQLSGALLGIAAGRLVDPLDLAGVRRSKPAPPGTALVPTSRGPYRVIRHPLYLAWLVAVWATPVMTGTRLLIAVLSAIYVMVAIPLEERDLRRYFGPAYATYATRVRHRLVRGLY